MGKPLILVFSLLLAQPARSSKNSWLDITNASSSEGNIINCTWGILCRKGFQRPAGETGEEFCEAGFECVPASSGSLPQEATSAPDGKNSTNASETLPTVNALNQTHKNTSAKTPSLRGMRIGHIGGIGHPGFHPVHPGPFRPYRPIHPYYHPWRPYRPYYRPWLYPRRERVWGNAITCPCGVYCRWGFRYVHGRRVCNGALLCTPCV